jgi:hypothetical protein
VVKAIAHSTPAAKDSRSRRKVGRKTRKASREEYVSHVIRVRTWEFYYSRYATDPKSKWERGPIGEIATLRFIGEVVRPKNCKYKEGNLTFSGREDFVEREPGTMLVPIGSATARGEEIEGYLFVPEERLRLLLTAAQTGRVEMVQFTGPKLRYGGSLVHTASVNTHFDEDEW